MKKLTAALLLVIPAAICSAQDGNQASLPNVEAKVQIVRPIHVERKADLVFGQLIVDPVHGQGIVTVYDTPTLDGSHMWWKNNPAGGNAVAHPALFTVTGEEGYGFSYGALELMNLTKGGVGTPITWRTLFDKNPNAIIVDGGTGTITTDIRIGGSLTVAPGTGPGTYSGQFEVHVAYM